jgi:hypothetical protein
MKKITPKAQSAAAPSMPTKPMATKPVTAKPSTPKPAAAKSMPPKSSAAPAVKKTATPLNTVITAAIDVGFGNSLTLRGEGPGLSWQQGVVLECVADDRWTITLRGAASPIVCKLLINDLIWCTGSDYTVIPGASVVLSPTF